MTDPPSEAGPLHLPEAEFHRGLFRRSAVLPSVPNQDGRIRLSDTMLGLAMLAACFALLRQSTLLGIASLVLLFPTLARTHVVMNQRRQDGESPHLGSWMLAFVSSMLRVVATLAVIGMMQGLDVLIGVFLGYLIASVFVVPFGGPYQPLDRTGILNSYGYWGGILGYGFLGILTTAFLLTFLAPRLLSIRERVCDNFGALNPDSPS
jgi:hypothetical protein